MANKKQSYNEAIKEIEMIVSEIESETVDVDALTDKVKRAAGLIKMCKTRLRETEKELNAVLEEFSEEEETKGVG